MRRFLILVLAPVTVPVLFAQSGSISVNSGTVDCITTTARAIDSLVTSGGALFVSTGNQILTSLGIIMLVVCGLRLAAESASRHHGEFGFPALIQFFALFLIAEALIRYYDSPLPWTNVSVSRILP